MLSTIQSMTTYSITNKYKRLPTSITDLSLGNYSIVYNNNCDNFASLDNYLGLTITPITGSDGNCFKMTTDSAYGIISNINNISLLNKTIVVKSRINYTGRFYFGCDVGGNGYAFQYDASGAAFSYVGKCVQWIITENIGPITSGTDTKIVNTGFFHTMVISINSGGNMKWGLQQSNYYNGPTLNAFNFLGGQLYSGSTSYVVDPNKKLLAFNCYGETYIDTIDIYNSAV